MPLIPTLDGTPVEHSDIEVSDANQRMRSCLERLATPTCTKARQTVEKVAELWAGRDGTKMMRGVRVLPTSQAVRCLATLVRHQPPAVRIGVFSALEYARELVTEASDEIGIGLRDEDPNVRLAAARLLAWVASSDDLVLSALESLADPYGPSAGTRCGHSRRGSRRHPTTSPRLSSRLRPRRDSSMTGSARRSPFIRCHQNWPDEWTISESNSARRDAALSLSWVEVRVETVVEASLAARR